MPTVTETIRRARLEAGLSQAELALKARTSQPALARYESGATLPTLPTLERILAACGRQLTLGVTSRSAEAATPISIRGQLGPASERLRHRRKELIEAASRRGLRRLRVFGSVALGVDSDGSDVDLLVELKDGATLLDVVAFRHEAESILGLPVDVATRDMLKPRIRSRVESEALPL